MQGFIRRKRKCCAKYTDRQAELGNVISTLYAPVYATVVFVRDEDMTYEKTTVLKLIKEED